MNVDRAQSSPPSLGGDGQAWPQALLGGNGRGTPSDPGPSRETAAAEQLFLV